LASLWEGLPTVILEAMAIKVPVIATAIPGTDELVQDGKTGWLVPPEDPVSLASAIIKAYQYPEEQELIVTNAYDNLKRFRIDMVAKQYYELYRRSLNKFYNNYNS